MVPWTGRPLSAVVSLVGPFEPPEQEASGIRAAREAAQRRNERREGCGGMKLVKQQGGHSIAVYKPNSSKKENSLKLISENR